jgi:uncharacterized protein (TIGR02453 family)
VADSAYFTPDLFGFLRDLSRNNRREWFQAHRGRYEESVRAPAQRFIVDFDSRLRQVSPHFLADPRPIGGSLFRIYRDTRFAKDKTPYKTHAGIHFRHRAKETVHAPGFYLHMEPGQVFLAAGIWHPDGPTLARIRNAIVTKPAAWRKARDDRRFRARFEIGGDTLVRAPRGYDPEHPFLEDLKRKDFVASAMLTERDVLRPNFILEVAAGCRDAVPFVRWLCGALELPF